jgi:hypothetical protein
MTGPCNQEPDTHTDQNERHGPQKINIGLFRGLVAGKKEKNIEPGISIVGFEVKVCKGLHFLQTKCRYPQQDQNQHIVKKESCRWN